MRQNVESSTFYQSQLHRKNTNYPWLVSVHRYLPTNGIFSIPLILSSFVYFCVSLVLKKIFGRNYWTFHLWEWHNWGTVQEDFKLAEFIFNTSLTLNPKLLLHKRWGRRTWGEIQYGYRFRYFRSLQIRFWNCSRRNLNIGVFVVAAGVQNWKIQRRQYRYHFSRYGGLCILLWYRFDAKLGLVAPQKEEGYENGIQYNMDILECPQFFHFWFSVGLFPKLIQNIWKVVCRGRAKSVKGNPPLKGWSSYVAIITLIFGIQSSVERRAYWHEPENYFIS